VPRDALPQAATVSEQVCPHKWSVGQWDGVEHVSDLSIIARSYSGGAPWCSFSWAMMQVTVIGDGRLTCRRTFSRTSPASLSCLRILNDFFARPAHYPSWERSRLGSGTVAAAWMHGKRCVNAVAGPKTGSSWHQRQDVELPQIRSSRRRSIDRRSGPMLVIVRKTSSGLSMGNLADDAGTGRAWTSLSLLAPGKLITRPIRPRSCLPRGQRSEAYVLPGDGGLSVVLRPVPPPGGRGAGANRPYSSG